MNSLCFYSNITIVPFTLVPMLMLILILMFVIITHHHHHTAALRSLAEEISSPPPQTNSVAYISSAFSYRAGA